MKKIIFSFFLICLAAIFILFITKTPEPFITVDNHRFFVELAKSEQDKEQGLAKYTVLPQNRAMYFPFTKADYYAFWMKNMHFPIDIIFIRDNTIVTILDNIPVPKSQTHLPTYRPTSPADSVLEINAGLAKKYGFHTGDAVHLHL